MSSFYGRVAAPAAASAPDRKSSNVRIQNGANKRAGKPVAAAANKTTKKLERILEYSAEFEEAIKSELEVIKRDSKGGAATKPVDASRGGVITCASVADRSSAEVMENTFQTTFLSSSGSNPFLYITDPSFDFRDVKRVVLFGFLKKIFD